MVALANTAITLSRLSKVAEGNRFVVTFQLTLTGDASGTWTSVGLAMPTGWKRTIGLPGKVDTVTQLTPLRIAGASPHITYSAFIDLVNDKLLLIGGATTAAEDVPFEALPDTFTPAAAAYIGTFRAVGY